jgi:hypothetical protein
MEDSQRDRYGKAVRERWPGLFRTRENEEWRQILLALADQNIERLNAKLEVHEENADAQAERTFTRLSFDPSPEGEALRNYLIKCTTGFSEEWPTIVSTRPERAAGGTGPVPRGGTEPNRTGQRTEDVKPTRGVVRSSGLMIRSGREMAWTIVSSARA